MGPNAKNAAEFLCRPGPSVPAASSTPMNGSRFPGGTVSSYVYVNMAYFGQPVQPPFIASLIKLEGTDVNFLHLIAGFDLQNFDHVEKTMRKNMKVSAVWNNDRTGNIFDIKYFEPV